MPLAKIIEKELVKIKPEYKSDFFEALTGESASPEEISVRNLYESTIQKLEPYGRRIFEEYNSGENKIVFAIPSIHGMEVTLHYKEEGRLAYQGNRKIIGPGSRDRVLCEGTPTLTVKLSYLETTTPEDLAEIESLLKKD